MCGLVGLINKRKNGFIAKQQEIFSSLLFVDYLRGMDSTGVFLVRNNGDVSIAKEASDPITFMNSQAYVDLMKQAYNNGAAIIGHNRKATRGTVNDDNAHPFIVDDKIVLVHNGTMFGDHKKIANVEVDSHAIAHAIHEEKDVTKALSSFDAAFALIWYDFDTATVSLIRNSQRPLWFVETPDEWLWASEKAFLDLACTRHELTTTAGPFELTPEHLQTYKLDSRNNNNWQANYEELKLTVPRSNAYQQQQQQYIGGGVRHITRQRTAAEELALDDSDYYNQHWPDYAGAPNDSPFHEPSPRYREAQTKFEDMVVRTSKFEKEMASRENKIVTNGEFSDSIFKDYPSGSTHFCQAYDYCLVNHTDNKDGFYLYLAPVDDKDVIFRVKFKGTDSEERIMQMASSGYIFKLEVDRKMWSPFIIDRDKYPDYTKLPGYVVIISDKIELVHGGGIDGGAKWNGGH